MSNIMDKIGEKLHVGGHKDDKEHVPQAYGQQAGYSVGGPAAHVGVAGAHDYGSEPPKDERPATHEGPVDKIKKKVKGIKDKTKGEKEHSGGGSSSSSSSSESDGEGGRR